MLALHTNERVLGSYRKMWIVFATKAGSATLLALAPLFALPFLDALPWALPIPGSVLALALIVWWWSVWMWAFLEFANYYLDVFVVTDGRIIHIEQLGLFRRRVAELRLERVQDVAIEQLGFLPTMLHFGNLRVQTAGETGSFIFAAIPNPAKVKEVIMDAHREALHRQRTTLSGT